MTNQSNAAAERSAHVTRGVREVPAEWPVVQLPDGTWQLKAVVERDAEIEKLRAERRAMQGALLAIKAHTKDAHPMSYMDQLCRIACAALGEKE